jgi:hypothetical protein
VGIEHRPGDTRCLQVCWDCHLPSSAHNGSPARRRTRYKPLVDGCSGLAAEEDSETESGANSEVTVNILEFLSMVSRLGGCEAPVFAKILEILKLSDASQGVFAGDDVILIFIRFTSFI